LKIEKNSNNGVLKNILTAVELSAGRRSKTKTEDLKSERNSSRCENAKVEPCGNLMSGVLGTFSTM
jgi:hypothetical protein